MRYYFMQRRFFAEFFRFCFFISLSFSLNFSLFAKKNSKQKTAVVIENKKNELDLETASFEEIIKNYVFVGDFQMKESTRDISQELFWKYPFLVPKIDFPIEFDFGDQEEELVATQGADTPIIHMNRGRILFMEKKYEEARKTWLSARARFGQKYDFHRRNDYFISLGFLKLSQELFRTFKEDLTKDEVRLSFANTSTFLSWAFIVKKDLKDPFLDSITPKGLYNLAAIYYKFGRYAGAHGAADEGLNFLRKTGRKDYRHKLHRVLAENWIKNTDYLEAVKELDTAIRQDPDPSDTALSFMRVADMYFDLNNYELADDIYSISQNIDRQLGRVTPISLLLRGESLFWQGKFEKSQALLQSGLEAFHHKNRQLLSSNDYSSWAKLRIADAYLARYAKNEPIDLAYSRRSDLLEKAKLAYFQVTKDFPKSEAASIAKIRIACLDLPVYEGNNIKHARQVLDLAPSWQVSMPALELAFACQVSSFSQRELTEEMVEKVRSFARRYPKSRYLKEYIEPVKEVRGFKLDEYLEQQDYSKAKIYYESYKDLLFKKLSLKRQKGLFLAYVLTDESEKAFDFWPAVRSSHNSALDLLRKITFLAEQTSLSKNETLEESKKLADLMIGHELSFDEEIAGYLWRIYRSNYFSIHARWMSAMAFRFDDAISDAKCTMLYPFLSKSLEDGFDKKEYAWDLIKKTIEMIFPAIITKDKECAMAYLDLEARFADDDPVRYAMVWMNRLDWPKLKSIVSYIWMSSEILSEKGHEDLAQKLWLFIASNKTDYFEEQELAKARLDKTQTQTQKLWEKK